MEEQWKQIEKFPNYQISNLGNVKNIITNKILKPCKHAGYYGLSLINSECKKHFLVHRLVAIAFIPNPENKPEVNHKDKNTNNNSVDNLNWMTKSENGIHRCKDLVITTNKNKPLNRICIKTGLILETYNSINDAALWIFNNKLSKNTHNARNSIGNCICGLSNTSYGFKWEAIKKQDCLENEIWKEVNIPNVNNNDKKYFVSNLGRFKSSKNIIMENYKINPNGYIRVFIYGKTYLLHRLISFMFIDNPENKQQVNHIDGNKTNNKVDNLEWVTNQENQIHKFKTGLGNNFTRKIGQYTLDNVFIKEHKSIASAAKENNINKSNIFGVLKEKRKTAGGFIWKYLD